VVQTPSLDWVAASGVRFTRAYCNNPICAPSRISFVSGQYPHTHRILGNDIFELDDANSATLGATFRRHGYQTALIGKGHMVRAWDNAAYEHIRYCDLCDADRKTPTVHHYFKYLMDHGLADMYEDGTLPREHEAGREFAICEWDYVGAQKQVCAIRTARHRLVYYSHGQGGELYDHETDPWEMTNRWADPECRDVRLRLLELLFDQVNRYTRKADMDSDARRNRETRFMPTRLLHKQCRKWSEIEALAPETR
jgi:arylsulfatase A-like enzyme